MIVTGTWFLVIIEISNAATAEHPRFSASTRLHKSRVSNLSTRYTRVGVRHTCYGCKHSWQGALIRCLIQRWSVDAWICTSLCSFHKCLHGRTIQSRCTARVEVQRNATNQLLHVGRTWRGNLEPEKVPCEHSCSTKCLNWNVANRIGYF